MGVGSNGAAGKSLTRTASLPASSIAFTICGHAQWRSKTGDPTIAAVESGTTSASKGIYLEFVTGTLNIATDITDIAFGASPAVNTQFFWAFSCAGTGAGQLVAYWCLEGATSFNTVSMAGSSFTPVQISLLADSFGDTLDAFVQDVKVWSAALSSAELLQESRVGFAVRQTNLYSVASLKSTSDIGDISGNGHGWTANGALTSEVDAPVTWNPWEPQYDYMVSRVRQSSRVWQPSDVTFVAPIVTPSSAATQGEWIASPRSQHRGRDGYMATPVTTPPPQTLVLGWDDVAPSPAQRTPRGREGYLATPAIVPTAPTLPLGWDPSLPQVAPRPSRARDGVMTTPAIPPDVSVDLSESVLLDEFLTAENAAPWEAQYPDRVPQQRRILPEGSVGPVAPPASAPVVIFEAVYQAQPPQARKRADLPAPDVIGVPALPVPPAAVQVATPGPRRVEWRVHDHQPGPVLVPVVAAPLTAAEAALQGLPQQPRRPITPESFGPTTVIPQAAVPALAWAAVFPYPARERQRYGYQDYVGGVLPIQNAAVPIFFGTTYPDGPRRVPLVQPGQPVDPILPVLLPPLAWDVQPPQPVARIRARDGAFVTSSLVLPPLQPAAVFPESPFIPPRRQYQEFATSQLVLPPLQPQALFPESGFLFARRQYQDFASPTLVPAPAAPFFDLGQFTISRQERRRVLELGETGPLFVPLGPGALNWGASFTPQPQTPPRRIALEFTGRIDSPPPPPPVPALAWGGQFDVFVFRRGPKDALFTVELVQAISFVPVVARLGTRGTRLRFLSNGKTKL